MRWSCDSSPAGAAPAPWPCSPSAAQILKGSPGNWRPGDGPARPCPAGEPASVAALDHGQGEDAVADAPAAVGHLLDMDHGVGACFLAIDLGVQVGGAVDDEFLLLGGQGTGGHLEVREWDGGGALGSIFAGWLEARAGGQELGDTDAVVELDPDTVVDGGDDFAAVAAGVDVGAEGPLAGGQVDHPHDLVGDFCGVVAVGEDAGQVLSDDLAQFAVA